MKPSNNRLISEILYWKKKRNVLILAHNYQIPEIQDIADFVGDSLELSLKAAKTDAKIIVFCGVHFMAETTSILSPEKTVLIPDLHAGCSLAETIDAKTLRIWKKKYHKAVVLAYVNTSTAVKAESDYCCTSSNAVKVVNSIPIDKQILFVPDMFLADFVAKTTGREIIAYPGECHVHAKVKPKDVAVKMKKHPTAEFLIHPECGCVSSCMYYLVSNDIQVRQIKEKTHIFSTGGMIKHARNSKTREFVIATETGILHRLRKENLQKSFIPLREDMICRFMKMITLPKLLNSLKNLVYEVKVPEEIAERARIPIERMLNL